MLNRDKTKEHLSSFEVCLNGMHSIFENQESKSLVSDNVLNDVKDHQFQIEKITLVKLIDDYQCDVVAKDRKGHRSYKVQLDKSSKNPHLYKIVDIKGQAIVSNYQWKD